MTRRGSPANARAIATRCFNHRRAVGPDVEVALSEADGSGQLDQPLLGGCPVIRRASSTRAAGCVALNGGGSTPEVGILKDDLQDADIGLRTVKKARRQYAAIQLDSAPAGRNEPEQGLGEVVCRCRLSDEAESLARPDCPRDPRQRR